MIWLIIVFGWLPIGLVSMYLQWTEDDCPHVKKPQQPQQKSEQSKPLSKFDKWLINN